MRLRFRCISLKTLLLRLSSSTSIDAEPLSQVMSVLAVRSVISSSFSSSAGLCPSAGYSSLRCLQQAEFRNVKTSVWWDFYDCNLPEGTNGFKVVPAITTVIRSSGIKGPITITAFGDVSHLSTINRKELSSTGINLLHVPEGKKQSVNKAMLDDLMLWVHLNPPPAHVFVISSDKYFARTLHVLRMHNYNVLLASIAYAAPPFLCIPATIMWDWYPLVQGRNVTGRHFNQPPVDAWYGHYRVPLQDPFATVELSKSVKTEESLASNSNLDTKEIDKSKTPGFFNQIVKWFKFWERDATVPKLGDEKRELGDDLRSKKVIVP